MDALIKKMRCDWPVIAAENRATGYWTEEDEAEVGAAIKAAVDSGDIETIGLWCRYLADLSAMIVGLKTIPINSRIRAEIAKKKAKEAGATK